jgi:hypothetical protein
MAGASTTCSECGIEIETPARDLVVGGETLRSGCVIDLDQHWADVLAHYAAEHPGAELPPRIW